MKTRTMMKKRWLQLAIVPLFSVALITGCGSSDDDDDSEIVTGGDEIDGNGDSVPDAFQILDGDVTLDTNGNLIADEFEVPPAGSTIVASDSNNNDIDDSFEASLTGGDDLDPVDGIDDAAAANLAENGAGTIDGANGAGTIDGATDAGATDGGATDAGATDGGATDAGATDGGATDGGAPTGGEVPTGSLDGITFGTSTTTTADLIFNGSSITGSVDAPGAGQNSVAFFSGIPASAGPVQQLINLNGAGPTFFVPSPLSDQENAPILENFLSGSLFIQINAGEVIRSSQLLPPGDVISTIFTPLEVATGSGLSSNGAAFLNVNTVTGQFTTVATVNLDVSDLDGNGNTVSVAAANIHSGSPTGPVIVELTMDSLTAFSATGTLSAADLDTIQQNNAWVNITLNDGNTPGASFVTGQIVATQP